MTDAVQVALIIGVPATITALAGLVVAIHNSWKASALAPKVDAIADKVQVVKDQSDGHLTQLTTDLKAASNQVAALQQLVGMLVADKKDPPK